MVYSAGIFSLKVSAGCLTTCFVTVRYSAGTSTRHRISPVASSIFSIGPRPRCHVVYAGRTTTCSVTVS